YRKCDIAHDDNTGEGHRHTVEQNARHSSSVQAAGPERVGSIRGNSPVRTAARSFVECTAAQLLRE
ncbi:MAG: hypothetical protein ABFR53_04145, partial [Actinomycetota bacterium]